MANLRMESTGFEIGACHFPPFQVHAGEIITLSLPNSALGAEKEILQSLTGKRNVPGLILHASVHLVIPANPPLGWIRCLSNPTPFAWLKSNTRLSEADIRSLMTKHGLDPNIPLRNYAGTPRMLLGLEAAYATGPEVIVFSTSGLDPSGVKRVYQTVAEHLAICSAIYLAWPFITQGEERYYQFPNSSLVSVGTPTTDQGRPIQESVS